MALNIQPVVTNPGRWQRGKASPNPGGRPADESGQATARLYVPEAFKALVIALHVKGERVAAAKEILDRAYGKPKQVISTDGEQFNITHLHMLAAQIVSEEIIARQAQPQTITPDETTKIATQQRLLDAPKPTE